MQQSDRIGRGIAVVVLLAGLSAFGAEDTNMVSAVKADEDAGWESVFAPSNQIPFYVNLYMKNGFYYEVVEDSSYSGTSFPKSGG